MFKISAYILAFSLLFFAVSFAIDKDEDKKQERKKVDTLMKAPNKIERSSVEKKKPDTQKSTGDKDYNNFIDRNNNGIDDRAENKKVVSPKKTDSSKTQTGQETQTK